VSIRTDRELVHMLGKVGIAFFGSFDALREVQRRALPVIVAGRNSLVCSPTASGKTEAVIAPLIARHCATPQQKIRIL